MVMSGTNRGPYALGTLVAMSNIPFLGEFKIEEVGSANS